MQDLRTPLHIAAAEGNVAMVSGCTLPNRCQQARVCLWAACALRNTQSGLLLPHMAVSAPAPARSLQLRILVDVGADVGAKDRWGSTPLDEAKRAASQPAVDYLAGVAAGRA